YFLIDAPPANLADTSQTLEGALAPYGFDAVPTGEKIASFLAVQNTYLSTFQTLGGLGLLLGTIGLGVILIRNVLERRKELAAMRAFGFERSTLTRMVVLENALLLIAGLGIGSVAALLAVSGHLITDGATVPWVSLLTTLGIILAVGLLATTIAASGALRTQLLPALKAER
ncbi:MAG: FtsX-like permease family protein, partial [Acidobacteriota bacterium]